MPVFVKDESMVLPLCELRRRVSYDPQTGGFTRLPMQGDDRVSRSFNARFANKSTGCLTRTGYVDLKFQTAEFGNIGIRAHRVAFALMTGEWPAVDQQIDHRNNQRADNRWKNLRPCIHLENGVGKTLSKRSSTGLKGVTHRKGLPKPWKAQIATKGRKYSLGYFTNPKDAARAYDLAAQRFFGEHARTNASMGLL